MLHATRVPTFPAMYDIFLSYATADRQRVQPLHDALCQQGWAVFWDHTTIKSGERWPQRIETALNHSHCMVVVWTASSVASDWVREEATHGKEHDKLLPLRWEDTPPPLGFKVIQTADFRDWNGQPDQPRFQELAARIRDFVPATPVAKLADKPATPPPAPPSPPISPQPSAKPPGGNLSAKPALPKLAIWGGSGALVLVAAVAFFTPGKPPVPAHRSYEPEMVAIPGQNYALGKYEVTQGQWKAVMGSNPSGFKQCGDDCLVENVSWDDAQGFIQKLNEKTDKQYRLPTEKEWQTACLVGQPTEYCGSNDINAVAWYGYEKSGKTTHSVGQKQSNAWGLYDMSGNVLEWMQDCDGSSCEARVLRGGSWFIEPQYLRSDSFPLHDCKVHRTKITPPNAFSTTRAARRSCAFASLALRRGRWRECRGQAG